MSNSLIATRVLRHVKELEASVKRLETTYIAEMDKVDAIIAQLSKEMEVLTGDSEREASM
jgi:hypothetical protein